MIAGSRVLPGVLPVVGAERHVRPSVVGALSNQVQLVAAGWTMFGREHRAVTSNQQPFRVSVAFADDLVRMRIEIDRYNLAEAGARIVERPRGLVVSNREVKPS